MPLYDYDCQTCHHHFEQIARSSEDPEAGVCPDCGTAGATRRVSRFRVGGRGDLRETTAYHGCHSALDVHHDHGHSHGASAGGGHVHSPGCGHGSSNSKAPSGGAE